MLMIFITNALMSSQCNCYMGVGCVEEGQWYKVVGEGREIGSTAWFEQH